ncbi:hypothetical protein L1987_52961 [Smallanthus sonchifolius]|uniref:Uncharacterized protein n=1 Tax=Smallanthus sonchifolius TaxID=185202 RepID=A0ACB9EV05_9ASTR|nr:hypothetical protein L1987_52961 [Smallanthus sonchifolius]
MQKAAFVEDVQIPIEPSVIVEAGEQEGDEEAAESSETLDVGIYGSDYYKSDSDAQIEPPASSSNTDTPLPPPPPSPQPSPQPTPPPSPLQAPIPTPPSSPQHPIQQQATTSTTQEETTSGVELSFPALVTNHESALTIFSEPVTKPKGDMEVKNKSKSWTFRDVASENDAFLYEIDNFDYNDLHPEILPTEELETERVCYFTEEGDEIQALSDENQDEGDVQVNIVKPTDEPTPTVPEATQAPTQPPIDPNYPNPKNPWLRKIEEESPQTYEWIAQKTPEIKPVIAGTHSTRMPSIHPPSGMPPRRATVTNNNTDIATILAQLVNQLTQANGAANGNHGVNGGGATGLLQWFESIENTFLNSDCPDNLPEFWDLAQDGGESLAYITRFHELSLLVPHMVTPLSRCIEKYIGGLPRQIQDTVLGRNPATLEDAIRLSATLTDNHVKAGTLTRKGTKKVPDTTTSPVHIKEATIEPSRNNKKRKARNYAMVTPAIPVNQAAPMVQAPAKKPYVGIYPLCATCNYHHLQNIPCRICTHCGKYGHTVNVCRAKALAGQVNPPNRTNPQVANQGVPAIANGRACYECGNLNHFRDQCPRLINARQGEARGRAFNINTNEAQANNDVVNGTFLVNSQYASILFDTGADKSFVSLKFEPLLAKTRSQLEKTFTVEVANGDSLTIESAIYDCSLELNEHTFPINLVPMPLGSFDIIIGMDWLSNHHAEVICFEKCIRIPLLSGETLKVFGEKPCKGLKLMSCTTAQKYLQKKYVAFLAHIVQKDVKEKSIQDIPIIQDFPEVFPEDLSSLPPVRQVEFRIDLVPGANPVARATYRLAPSEM